MFSLQPGSTNFDCVVSRGPRPISMYCVFVKSASLQGLKTSSPFNFVHNDLVSCVSTFEGRKFPSSDGHNMSFGTAAKPLSYDYTSIYHELLKSLGSLDNNITSVGLTEAKYRAGSTVIPFLYDMNILNTEYDTYSTGDGILSVSFKFRVATTVPMSVLFFPLVTTNMALHTDGVCVSN